MNTIIHQNYSIVLLKMAVEESEQQHLSLIIISPSRSYTIADRQDFRDGTYEELIEVGKTGKSLSAITKRERTRKRKRARKSH